MSRVGEGDAAAVEELFLRHHGAAYGLCCRLTSDSTASEDLVQETFMRVLRSAHTFRGGSGFRAWFFRIVRNVCVDHWRIHERRSRAVEGWRVRRGDDESTVGPLPGGGAPERPLVARLERALSELSSDQREVLVMSRYHDMSYAEIAEVTDSTAGAVKVRAHRAMKALRKAFHGLQAEGV